MSKEKSPKNKTINISIEEGKRYLERCKFVDGKKPVAIEELINKTVCGDVFKVAPIIPQKSIDLLIADPPYNLTKEFHGIKFQKRKHEEYRAYAEKWLDLLLPLVKDTGSIYICCDWQSSLIIGPLLMEKAILRNRITWQREKGRGAKSNWKNGMEDIWYATVSDTYLFNLDKVKQRRRVVAPYRVDGRPKGWQETPLGNYRDTCPSNFWDDISIPFWSMKENTAHPTQKPEKLIAKLILASSKPGDLILDPFLGSGTTSVVAKKLNRRYIGIEENELYCVWAEKRLEMAEEDSSIQGYTDGVFWERNTGMEQLKSK
ncbi:MAG: DNA-methyltransferase [Caldicoprobacterales bacterium]|jgi:site-specific DNA-methyltransferase (adenine-specific)|nr:site-specific DNA-methyltransferase [Clostridiales bacterium]